MVRTGASAAAPEFWEWRGQGEAEKKVRGHHKTKKYAKLRHFSFHGLFCIFQKLGVFLKWHRHVFPNFEPIFYHNYFTESLVLPDNFWKFSAVKDVKRTLCRAFYTNHRPTKVSNKNGLCPLYNKQGLPVILQLTTKHGTFWCNTWDHNSTWNWLIRCFRLIGLYMKSTKCEALY